jgi:hypothetical protein
MLAQNTYIPSPPLHLPPSSSALKAFLIPNQPLPPLTQAYVRLALTHHHTLTLPHRCNLLLIPAERLICGLAHSAIGAVVAEE